MPGATDDFFENFVVQQNAAAVNNGVVNHDIYEKRLSEPDQSKWPNFRLIPHSMYFYYARIDADGRFVIDHYLYVDGDPNVPATWQAIPYDEAGLTALVTRLAINARPLTRSRPTRNPTPRASGNFRNTKWERISYLAIFFDEANWTLRKRPTPGNDSAITFIVNDGAKTGTPNHSFFDAMDLTITMPIRYPKSGGPTQDTRSAIVLVNHMKGDEAGNPPPANGSQSFEFKILVDVKSASPNDPPTVFIVDPGGDNDGPGSPPPP